MSGPGKVRDSIPRPSPDLLRGTHLTWHVFTSGRPARWWYRYQRQTTRSIFQWFFYLHPGKKNMFPSKKWQIYWQIFFIKGNAWRAAVRRLFLSCWLKNVGMTCLFCQVPEIFFIHSKSFRTLWSLWLTSKHQTRTIEAVVALLPSEWGSRPNFV